MTHMANAGMNLFLLEAKSIMIMIFHTSKVFAEYGE